MAQAMTAGLPRSLPDWLAWQERLHPRAIELGLERIAAVHERLALGRPACHVVSVAGTNGKGSSVALLETIARVSGWRVGSYTSPHLRHYNERIRIDGRVVDDGRLCRAFAKVEAARGEITLSYFEFGTLAALDILGEAGLDLAVLEIGLGGRLDAVNVVDADIALLTSIGLDHADWLGNDRERIAAEKAAIMRPGRRAVCSDPEPATAIEQQARIDGVSLYRLGREFSYEAAADGWNWRNIDGCSHDGLPLPALAGRHQLDNAAGVIQVWHWLNEDAKTRQGHDEIERGLCAAHLDGRGQRLGLRGGVELLLDVAHNPASAQALADLLRELPCRGRTHVVIGLLADKDAAGVISSLAGIASSWYCARLEGQRGRPADDLVQALRERQPEARASGYETGPEAAYLAARAAAQSGDRIVVCGSFVTVAAVFDLLDDVDRQGGSAARIGYNSPS